MPIRSTRAAVVAIVAASAFPLAANAQTDSFYVAPKLVTRGSNSSAVAGKGTVTVKVFVHKTGAIDKPTRVAKSTNPADNAAALEIAASSKYKPAARDGKPVDAFYTFTLNFTGGGSGVDVGEETSNRDLRKAAAMERSGNYAGAKTQLATYLATAPNDKEANTLLAVADAFTDDASGAAAAFDKAGTVDAKYKALATRAYTNAAASALKSGNADTAAAYAGKALALQPTADGYNIRGTAEYNLKKYDVAIADLEKARDMAVAQKADNHQLAIVETNLAAAYLSGGQADKGLATAKDVQRLDPSITQAQDAIAQYYNDKAAAALKAGNRADAAALLDTGAAAVPKYSVSLYSQSALILAKDPKPDWKKVKAEADKALAIDPADVRANFVAGVALANDNDTKDALTYLNKAQAAVKPDTDPALTSQINDALKKLSPSK